MSARATDGFTGVLGRVKDQLKGLESTIPGINVMLDRAHPLDLDIEPASTRFSGLLSRLDSNPASIPAQQAADVRAIAALAQAFPPEIAAYRSFGAPMRRRLYAELLTRESVRLAAAGEPLRPERGAP
ncbi:hypothetical protein MKK75_03065 [Methylobacterium sp. J-030]|uniref:hypothetical protein n=1 Tax=Methylobacterium sp. J-030 TaxID=2836627 RepID=UPI001FBA8754|nr:hypothetical protein [Methylobacterium sp. J-030]MCJ2067796.1 hypothetical protein [Methylobacterium sp. J-030]